MEIKVICKKLVTILQKFKSTKNISDCTSSKVLDEKIKKTNDKSSKSSSEFLAYRKNRN